MTDLLRNAIWREIQEAEAKAMARLLEAWDREIEAQAQAARVANARHAVKTAAKNRTQQRWATAEAKADHFEQREDRAALIGASIEGQLHGLVARALTGQDVSSAIPSGSVRVASTVGTTSNAEIAALVAQARSADDPVRNSAAWAVGHGFMPHPEDLAELLDRGVRDPSWAEGFRGLGPALDATREGPTSLRVQRAHAHLDLLTQHRRGLVALGPKALLGLIVTPERPLTTAQPRFPTPAEGGARMGQAALDAVLDKLFFEKK